MQYPKLRERSTIPYLSMVTLAWARLTSCKQLLMTSSKEIHKPGSPSLEPSNSQMSSLQQFNHEPMLLFDDSIGKPIFSSSTMFIFSRVRKQPKKSFSTHSTLVMKLDGRLS